MASAKYCTAKVVVVFTVPPAQVLEAEKELAK